MRFRVVTTMNEAGWRETGRRMVESFNERWAESLRPIVLYAEGFEPDLAAEVRPLPDWVDAFKARFREPIQRGIYRGQYDYRFDAAKFVHKVGAITDLGLSLTDEVMVWLDADTFTHGDVTEEWLDSLWPANAYLAWLDRANSHPECGFLMFRCSHPYHRKFMESFRNMYESGAVFKLREYHDSFALQQLVLAKSAHGKIPSPASLSGDARNWHHPFVAGPLGSRIDHMKGPRKTEGRSRPRDLRRPRQEAYWRG